MAVRNQPNINFVVRGLTVRAVAEVMQDKIVRTNQIIIS